MPFHIHRRHFLQRAAGLTAFSTTVPGFLHQTGRAFDGDPAREIPPIPGLPNNRVLVIIQLAGGNDGLNTLVPHGDDAYYRARPTLAIDPEQVLLLDDHMGMHPELVEFRRLFDDGELAVIQNVGYPNPNRSHFRSTEIWETASAADETLETGWIGRYFDHECSGSDSPMLGLQYGERPAQTFAGPDPRAVTMANPAILDWPTEGVQADGIERINQVEPTGIEALDFVQRTANRTLGLSRQVGDALGCDEVVGDYRPYQFSQSLKQVAQMIIAEVPTRVYYVSLGGFDTHVNQSNRHAGLLQELSEGIKAFHRDLKAAGHLDRTLVMTFSEFGRRIDENRSAGTDHGTANVVFLMGDAIHPGLHGPNPDLSTHLDEGDLVHAIDFRGIYQSVLCDWFEADASKVLPGSFASPRIVRTS